MGAHNKKSVKITDLRHPAFRTCSTLTERLLAVGILKGEETPRRGTPVLACRVPMDEAGLLVECGGGARVPC